MNKQELIKKYEGEFPSIGMNLSTAIKFKELWVDILGLDEPQKPVVPQFVADHLENSKEVGRDLQDAMNSSTILEEVDLWLYTDNNMDVFARAWLDGYTVEEEKRYLIKVKNIGDGWEYLKWNSIQQYWYFGNKKRLDDVRLYHTLENLQKGGFGNVFVNPLFTIEEVQDDSKI